MLDYRFYLEYPNKTEKNKGTRKNPGNHTGNCVALALREDGYFLHNYKNIDAIGAVFFTANSPVCGTSVSFEYKEDRLKKISEQQAREIHPELFKYLDN